MVEDCVGGCVRSGGSGGKGLCCVRDHMARGNTNANRGADIIEVPPPRGCNPTHSLFPLVQSILKRTVLQFCMFYSLALQHHLRVGTGQLSFFIVSRDKNTII